MALAVAVALLAGSGPVGVHPAGAATKGGTSSPTTGAAPRAAPVVRAAGEARRDVRVAIAPERRAVRPGEEFDVEIVVTEAGPRFNGYDAVVEFDPAALALVPAESAAAQEGPDMRGACGNTFHRHRAAGDSAAVSHVLMCGGVALEGPARLYRLRFRAGPRPDTTGVRLRSAQFYDAGVRVPTARLGATMVTIHGHGQDPARGTAPADAARDGGRNRP